MPEGADWYIAGFLLVWGSDISMTRGQDAHFHSEVSHRGARSAAIAPTAMRRPGSRISGCIPCGAGRRAGLGLRPCGAARVLSRPAAGIFHRPYPSADLHAQMDEIRAALADETAEAELEARTPSNDPARIDVEWEKSPVTFAAHGMGDPTNMVVRIGATRKAMTADRQRKKSR